MDIKHYFEVPDEVQRAIRRRTLAQLEDLYIYNVTDEDEDIDFETFLERTIQDMEAVENYEGAQCLKDIKRSQGWR